MFPMPTVITGSPEDAEKISKAPDGKVIPLPCSECGGSGEIKLFTSTVPCGCRTKEEPKKDATTNSAPSIPACPCCGGIRAQRVFRMATAQETRFCRNCSLYFEMKPCGQFQPLPIRHNICYCGHPKDKH